MPNQPERKRKPTNHMLLLYFNSSPNVGKAVAMAPALTEPISHRQSKISSPAQASSPRPIISDVSDQTQTTTATNPHHRLAHQTNGGGLPIGDQFATTKDVQSNPIENQLIIEEQQQLLQQQQQQLQATQHQSPKKICQFKGDQLITPDFQSIFVQQIQTSNG